MVSRNHRAQGGLGYRVVLPVATYFAWQGTNLEGRGIVPDIEEPVSTEALLNERDNQLARAVECLHQGVAA